MLNKLYSKIARGWNFFFTKLHTLFHEREYVAYGTRVKYMLFKNPANKLLLVSFPACSPNDARYNYMRTLSEFKCNKLFLLDDFGSNHRGCYLVEENVERCTLDLLNETIRNIQDCCCGNDERKEVKIVFLGSSKGGYSALNFSFLIPGVNVVVGAPQYYLGSYMDNMAMRDNLRYITGEITEKAKQRLNLRLKNRILNSPVKPKTIFFHYSKVEHTYKEHVCDMLKDLAYRKIEIKEDVQNYSKHGDLKDFYPIFLKDSIKKIASK